MIRKLSGSNGDIAQNNKIGVISKVQPTLAHPHCFDPDPDPAQSLDADTDPDPGWGGGGVGGGRSAKKMGRWSR